MGNEIHAGHFGEQHTDVLLNTKGECQDVVGAFRAAGDVQKEYPMHPICAVAGAARPSGTPAGQAERC